MFVIVSLLASLKQYLELIAMKGIEAIRPAQCPTCGKAGLWCHGSYNRKADRENTGIDCLNPIPIYRFLCNYCGHTCSALPECIPPRRWYLWMVQQATLVLTIAGHSVRNIAAQLAPARSTIRRWQQHLQTDFTTHTFYLCSKFPELGRSKTAWEIFWDKCLQQMSLAHAMYCISHAGGKIPVAIPL